MDVNDAFPPEVDELASDVGEFTHYWGFKKIHGRVWTHIYLASTPLDAGVLMRRLGISKALVSLTLNDLLAYRVILEGDKSSRGTQTYVANPRILDVIFAILRRRERKMLARAEASFKCLKTLNPSQLQDAGLTPLRIDDLGDMIGEAQTVLSAILELASVDLGRWESFTDTTKGPKTPAQ